MDSWLFGLLFSLVAVLGYMAVLFTIFGFAEFLRRLHDDQKY
jgi:hypothetical protein